MDVSPAARGVVTPNTQRSTIQAFRRSGAATPFYDPTLSYQENYDLGPFGSFGDEPSAEERAALDLPEAGWAGQVRLRTVL